MAIPLKFVALGGGALALLLLATSKASASETNNQPVTPPTPTPGGRKTRPDPFPVGAGEAIVVASPGILTRREPDTRSGKGAGSNLIAAEGVSPNDAFTGTHVAVLQTGVAPLDGQGGEWWLIMTPGRGVGYARAVDSKGVKNFNLTAPIADGFDPKPLKPANIAGVMPVAAFNSNGADPFRPFGMEYDTVGKSIYTARREAAAARAAQANDAWNIARRRARALAARGYLAPSNGRLRIGSTNLGADLSDPLVAVCAAPQGTFLRNVPNAPSNLLVPNGGRLVVDDILPGDKQQANSPNNGGWARVRYLGEGMTQPAAGYVRSEWLVPA